MKNNHYKFVLGLGWFLCSVTSAEPLLNGLATYEYLGREMFIAAVYTETPTSDSSKLINDRGKKRMELRITANQYSARSLNRLWIEGMAINNSEAALSEHSPNLVQFIRIVNKDLMAGDIMIIKSVPGEGVHIFVNGIKLGVVEAEEFFPMLLRTWIGPIALSSNFRSGLLRAGKVDDTLLGRYQTLAPSSERIAAVATWNIPFPKTESNSEERGLAGSSQPSPVKPGISVVDTSIPTLSLSSQSSKQSTSNTVIRSQKKKLPPNSAIAPLISKADTASIKRAGNAKNTGDDFDATDSIANSTETSAENDNQVDVAKADTSLSIAKIEENIFNEEKIFDEEEEPIASAAESLLNRQLYHFKLMKWTYKYIEYPRRAQKRGEQGSVRLSVVIDRSGKLKNVSIYEKSRYMVLNAAAMDAVKDAAPYPSMPKDLAGEQFEFSLPIDFELH